jgi:hypothetical protein
MSDKLTIALPFPHGTGVLRADVFEGFEAGLAAIQERGSKLVASVRLIDWPFVLLFYEGGSIFHEASDPVTTLVNPQAEPSDSDDVP